MEYRRVGSSGSRSCHKVQTARTESEAGDFFQYRRHIPDQAVRDVNPDIYGSELSISVSENDSSISFQLAIKTAEHYNIGANEARSIVADIRKTVDENWQELATRHGLSRNAIERMKPAFAMEFK